MQNKFPTLVENSIARFSNSGLLVGDVVKFADGFKSKDCFKNLNDDVKTAVLNLAKTDKAIRVVDIKTGSANRAPGDNLNRANDFAVEITTELAPGYFDLQNKITVPSTLLVAANPYPNLPPIGDSLRKKEKINLKPVPPEENEEVVNAPYDQTLQSATGFEKIGRGDRSLGNVNVKIPSKTAKAPMEVGNYTKMYMSK